MGLTETGPKRARPGSRSNRRRLGPPHDIPACVQEGTSAVRRAVQRHERSSRHEVGREKYSRWVFLLEHWSQKMWPHLLQWCCRTVRRSAGDALSGTSNTGRASHLADQQREVALARAAVMGGLVLRTLRPCAARLPVPSVCIAPGPSRSCRRPVWPHRHDETAVYSPSTMM